MKMSHCKDHQGSTDKTLGCYMLRFDNGAPVTDTEVLAYIEALTTARNEAQKKYQDSCDRMQIASQNHQRQIFRIEVDLIEACGGRPGKLAVQHVPPDDTEGGAI